MTDRPLVLRTAEIPAPSQVPFLVLTTNDNKLTQLRSSLYDPSVPVIGFPKDSLEDGDNPLIDERVIKNRVVAFGIPRDSGIEYATAVSQGKISMFIERGGIDRIRAGQIEGVDPNIQNAVLLTSDSVVIVEDEFGRYVAVNKKDDPPEAVEKALVSINNKRKINFVGALSFASLHDPSRIRSIMSFFTAPLAEGVVVGEFPIAIARLSDSNFINLSNGGGYTVGFVTEQEYHQDHTAWVFIEYLTTPHFDKGPKEENARPFISGVTPLSLQTAHQTIYGELIGVEAVRPNVPRAPLVGQISVRN